MTVGPARVSRRLPSENTEHINSVVSDGPVFVLYIAHSCKVSMAHHIRVVVRELLEKLFPLDVDLEAYCRDRFFEECRKRWTDAMNPIAKINRLLDAVDPQQLLAELRKTHPQEVEEAIRRHHERATEPLLPSDTEPDTPPRSVPPAPSDPCYERVPRTALANRIFRSYLRTHRVATLLQTWRGGGKTLARMVGEAARAHGISSRWLTDYATEQSTVPEFYYLLTGERSIRDQVDFSEWLYRQTAPRGLLIVLLGTRGPELLLNQVAAVVRGYLASRPDSMFLVVGGERLLRLRQHTNYPWLRLLPSASFVDVPDLTPEEVTQLLGLQQTTPTVSVEHSALLHSLTGGHPWLLYELIRQNLFDPVAAKAELRHQIIQAKLLDRHLADPQARDVLTKLEHGEPVASIQDPSIRHDPARYAESRLYFDGLLRLDGKGRIGS